MAGKRQHILPRFLLKGFASRTDGEKVFAWVFRQGTSPFETVTENISVERHFYGKEGSLSADNEITSLEGGYAQLIDTLRGEKDDAEISAPLIANFVAHLSVRTKHLRESFRESTEYLLEQITLYLSDFNNFKRLIFRNPKLMREAFAEQLKNIPVPDWLKEMMLELMEAYAPSITEEMQPELEAMMREQFGNVMATLPEGFKEGHIKTLAKDPAPQPRADVYGRLRWFVRGSDSPLILGDIGCLFEVAGERRFKPIDDKGDNITNIFLPIAADKCLIGTSLAEVPEVRGQFLNEAMSKCSYEYFVSSESSPDKVALSSTIGSESGILSEKEMEQLAREIIQDIENSPQ